MRRSCAVTSSGRGLAEAGRPVRRKRALLWTLAALLLLLGLGFWLWKDVFVLRSVSVQGGSVEATLILEAAGLEIGESTMLLDEAQVREGIDALGTVCLEEYQFKLPDRLLLRLRDREPAAMLPCGDSLLLIDGACCAIATVESVPDTDLLYLSGVELSHYSAGQVVKDPEGRMELCCRILTALEVHNEAMYISEIDLSDPDAPRFITRGGILVELRTGTTEAALALMEAAVADLERRGTVGGCLRVEDDRAFYSPMAAENAEV